MAEIQVTDEQGNTHIFPDGSTPDMIAKAMNVNLGNAASAPTDTRNAPQRFVDNLTTVTPEDEQAAKSIPIVGGAVNQAQKFGAGVIQGVAAPVVHPIQTLEGMGNTFLHPAQTVVNLGRSIAGNPSQTAGNVVGSALLGEAAAPIASAVGKVAGVPASRALLLGKTPEEAYESALKPSTTLSEAQRANIVQTGLQQGIPVSKSGLETLGDRVDALNQAIKGEIAADPTRPIDPNMVATRADIAKAKFAKQVNAQPDLNAIEASKQQFLTEQGAPAAPAIGPRAPAPAMNAIDAQEMKQGTYSVLRGKYGEQGSATVEAQKSLARGLKEEIANQFPEINDLNAQESKLLDLQPVLERAVNRISNHQLVGIGTPIVAGAAKAVTGSAGVGVVAGVLKSVLDNPLVKSRLAISLSKGAKIPYAAAVARVGAYSAALGANSASAAASPGDQTAPQP